MYGNIIFNPVILHNYIFLCQFQYNEFELSKKNYIVEVSLPVYLASY